MKKERLSAFPMQGHKVEMNKDQNLIFAAQTGMSLRDYFAAKAMQSLIDKMDAQYIRNEDYIEYWELPKTSYRIADAMLKTREQ